MSAGGRALAQPAFTPRSVAGGVERSEVCLRGEGVYWLEHRFAEGRSCVMRAAPSGAARPLTPADVDVGSLAWEYGGGSYLAGRSFVVYSDRRDQRLYRVEPGGAPLALTPAPALGRGERYADGSAAPDERWAAYVRESHGAAGQVSHSIVAVDLASPGPPRTLVHGRDFYASPTLSPDGRRLAWITWSKPAMPWDGSELWVAEVTADRTLTGAVRVAGSATESILAPGWSPAGVLHWVSDRSGWWNLYRLGEGGGARAIVPQQAEFAAPPWQHGWRPYGFLGDGAIAAVRIRDAVHELVLIDSERGPCEAIGGGLTSITGPHVSCDAGSVAVIGASTTAGPAVLTIDASSRALSTVAADAPAERPIAVAAPLWFDDAAGSAVHGFWYEPSAPRGRARPPLILNLHGGPTDSARLALDGELQLWTSRGFALLDLDYSGSSGFGSAYRHRLDGEWGRRDLTDCVAAVEHLVGAGLIDAVAVFVRGGSAGGYLTLRCITASGAFRGGMSRCGIADLALWRRDTHDYESRYSDLLVGPPSSEGSYAERSPARHVGPGAAPVLLVQGLADTVVPPTQADAMARAYHAAGRPHRLLAFEGEPHTFRRLESRVAWLAAEERFYCELLRARG